MTFTIIGCDQTSGTLGFASQSHFFGVGSVVGKAEAGVGVVVSQAFANTDWPHVGMDLLRSGIAPSEVVRTLVEADPLAPYRQLMVMNDAGLHASYTGSRCAPSTSEASSSTACAAGNMLGSGNVGSAMMNAYGDANGPLTSRLVEALSAAENTGGDARGSQSACLTVVGGPRTDTPWRQVIADIRVDDHPDPVAELARLIPIQEAFTVIGSTLFAPPLVIGDRDGIELKADAAVAALTDAATLLGPNREAEFWRGVVQIRSGAAAEGMRALDELRAAVPTLDGLVQGLFDVGILPPLPSEF